MNETTKMLLELISNPEEGFSGAYNIREDSGCAARQSTENIQIISKEDGSGIDIKIAPNTVGETVYIPAVITKDDIEDLVYNDFFIGENADVVIMAGCGIHSGGTHESSHTGIHRFFVGKNAKVKYLENHIGVGEGTGTRVIDPTTYVEIDEGGYMEMDTSHIKGIDSTKRKTEAKVGKGGNFIVKEKMMTHDKQKALTEFLVDLDGEGSGTHIVSRSVAKNDSYQKFDMVINGNNECHGHSECDAIIMDNGVVTAIPVVTANHIDSVLIHEAAIGKIAGEQITKLLTLGLTEEKAEETIVQGFLK